jgi:heat shock protein HslJ
MNNENDPVATAFDALRDDTRRLDTAEPLRSVGEARTGLGRRPLFLGAVTVAVLVIVGVVLFRDSGNDDLVVGPAGEPGLDGAQQDLSPADPATLIGSAWTLVSGTGPDGVVPLVDGWPITLTFDPETLGGTAACNGYGADYSLDGSRLAIEEIGRNDMGCADPVAASEAAFLAAIADTDSLFVRGEKLILSGPSTELRFRDVPPVPTAELVGRLWLLETLVQGETGSSARGTPATLRLDSDGTFVGGTGCRSLFGDYRVAGEQVRLSFFEAEGECPGELRDQDNIVVSVLTDGFTVSIESDRLTLTSVGNEGLTYRAITEDELESLPGDPVATDAELLPGTTWILRQGQGPTGPIDIIVGSEPVISFQADDTVTGNTSCNDFSADFTADGNRVSFRTLFRTVQGCLEPGVAEAEAAFIGALVDVSDFVTEPAGDELVLTGDATELVFDRFESPAEPVRESIDVTELLDFKPQGQVTVRGAVADTGGGWILCDRDAGAVPGCGGRWVTLTNYDPGRDPAGPSLWEGALTDDGRFALSGRDPLVTPTATQQAIADAFANLSIEGTTVDVSQLQLADRILIGLGNQLIEERTPAQLSDPAGWMLAPEYFRGYTGPFSAVETLRESDVVDVLVGPHDHCASPPRPISEQIDFATHLSLQPTGIDSCLQWFTVDLFLDTADNVIAIILDASEP